MYQPGDLLHIVGKDQHDNVCTFYGELVGINEDNMLEVYYLEMTKKLQGYIWSYSSDWDTVHVDCVKKSFRPTKDTYISVYKQFGFVPTVKENHFLKVGVVVPSNVLVPIALDSEEEMVDTDDDMSDFIVPDDVANEPFTHALPINDFVKEMHQAVHDYNKWDPKNNSEKKVKTFIDNMAKKYQQMDDNKQFANGTSLDYLHPPNNPLKTI